MINPIANLFSSSPAPYNPYQSSGYNQGGQAAVAPSAYGSDSVDPAFYNVNQRATPDGAISKMLIGGLTGFRFDKAAVTGSTMTQFMMNSAGVGAAISGTISIIKNVASLSHGKQDASTTVANVLTDTLQGSVSAVGGTLGAYGTSTILKALGAAAGAPLTIAVVVGGALGAVASNQILNTEKLRRSL